MKKFEKNINNKEGLYDILIKTDKKPINKIINLQKK